MRLTQRGQQFLRRHDPPRHLAEGQQTIAKDHLPDEFLFDERDGGASLGQRVARLQQAVDGVAVVNRQGDGLPEIRARHGSPPRAPRNPRAHAVAPRIIRIKDDGVVRFGESLVGPALFRQRHSQLAMRPGVRRIDFDQSSHHRLHRRAAVLAQALVPELVQGKVVRETRANLFEMAERGRAACGLGEQLRDRAVGIQGQRLGPEHLSPQLERLGQFAAQ